MVLSWPTVRYGLICCFATFQNQLSRCPKGTLFRIQTSDAKLIHLLKIPTLKYEKWGRNGDVPLFFFPWYLSEKMLEITGIDI